jgi:hypothetical protein
MLQLDISGSSMPQGVLIRESPTKTSAGQTTIHKPGAGTFMISSFFDIYIEVSTDGGQSWFPADQTLHMQLKSSVSVMVTGGKPVRNGCNWTSVFTVTATDACGNSSVCTVTFTWTEDQTPPSITCPADMTVSSDAGNCGAVVNFATIPDPLTFPGNCWPPLNGKLAVNEITEYPVLIGNIKIRNLVVQPDKLKWVCHSLPETVGLTFGTDDDCDSFFDIYIEVTPG